MRNDLNALSKLPKGQLGQRRAQGECTLTPQQSET